MRTFIPFYFRFSILFFRLHAHKMLKLLFYQKIVQIFINKIPFMLAEMQAHIALQRRVHTGAPRLVKAISTTRTSFTVKAS